MSNSNSMDPMSVPTPSNWVAVVGEGRGSVALSQAATGVGVGVVHLADVEQVDTVRGLIALFLAPPLVDQSPLLALGWLRTHRPNLSVYVVAGVLPAEAERKALYAASVVSVLVADESDLASVIAGLVQSVESTGIQTEVRQRALEICGLPGRERVQLSWAGDSAANSVMLSGSVPTLAHARQLRRDLMALPTINDVVSSGLRVDSGEISDEQISSSVAKALESSALDPAARERVHIQVFEGVVSLDGYEPEVADYEQLVAIIEGVPGVLDVRSTVTAQRASLPVADGVV